MKAIPKTLPDRMWASARALWLRAREAVTDEEQNQKLFALLRRFSAALSPTVFALLLSARALPLSVYPFGIALCAAAGGDTLFFSLGTGISALLSGEYPMLAAVGVLLAVRLLFYALFCGGSPLSVKSRLWERVRAGDPPFRESESLRIASAALGGFTAGVLHLLLGGLSAGDLVGALLSTLLCPALAYLYTGCFFAADRTGARYDAGLCALLASFVFALSRLSVFGISFPVIAAAFCAFLLARYKNPFTACLFAFAAIFVTEPLLSPAFAAAATAAALLFSRGRLYALSLGSAVFALAAGFTGGMALFADSFPEFLVGALLSLPVSRESAGRILPFTGEAAKRQPDRELLSYKEKAQRERVKEISAAFESLSRTFFELSDQKTRLGLFDTRAICDRVCDRVCKSCEACTLCWERDFAVTVETLNAISARLYQKGEVRLTDLPEAFRARCKRADRLLADISAETGRALRKRLETDRTREFAIDYGVFARVLSDALEKNEAEYAPDPAARRAVTEALAGIGFFADSIGVYGGRQKSVYAFRLRPAALDCKADAIRAALARALGGRVEDPLYSFSDGGIDMVVRQAASFCPKVSVFSRASASGEVNGDRVTAFAGKNGWFYALVNDGMGSGEAAARKSSAAALFLEKMLRAGNSAASGIKMLGALARADGEEVFTTVDLFAFDTVTGGASFIKSGAASSFVRRGSRLFKIRSGTLPVGILPDADAERTSFACEDGDVIVMLSDGVTEDVEEPVWLCEYLTRTDLSAPDAAAALIGEARAHTLCRDDMTAAVIRIEAV